MPSFASATLFRGCTMNTLWGQRGTIAVFAALCEIPWGTPGRGGGRVGTSHYPVFGCIVKTYARFVALYCQCAVMQIMYSQLYILNFMVKSAQDTCYWDFQFDLYLFNWKIWFYFSLLAYVRVTKTLTNLLRSTQWKFCSFDAALDSLMFSFYVGSRATKYSLDPAWPKKKLGKTPGIDDG